MFVNLACMPQYCCLTSSLHIGMQETRDVNAPIGDIRVLDPVVPNFTKT